MYQNLYKQIIDQAKSENRQKGQGVYLEWHHIVPEFMFKHRRRKGPCGHLDGDPNHPDNLVLLTFQEHLMCHYYLYEMHKDTRYGYQAGTALQFFFIKAGANHQRHINLSELDQHMITSMAHLRELGINSISKARKGKMPVVDAVTRQSMGSVPVDHPKVLSGEWIHHSKGRPGHKNYKSQKGNHNNNFKAMTPDRTQRVLDCVNRSLVDGTYFSVDMFRSALKLEFSEFKKVSHVWVIRNFGSLQAVVDKYNAQYNTSIEYNPSYKSSHTRSKIRSQLAGRSWVTDGDKDALVPPSSLQQFLIDNPTYSKGRTHA